MINEDGISVKELNILLDKMEKRLAIINQSEQTNTNYARAVKNLRKQDCKFTCKRERKIYQFIKNT